MTLSIWRYSHLTLAVSSIVFILLATLTGIILTFEPISEQIKPYKATSFDTITIAETLGTFDEKFDEVIDVQIDVNGFVLVDAITKEGESIRGYIDPSDGKYLGDKIEKSKFFQFTTSLHRSLFLKGIGRFFVGLCSFLLFLIAVSGTVLIIKRQGSVKQFFSKVIKENFAQYYHVILGRLFLIPIIIITITGVYLSLLRFDMLPSDAVIHDKTKNSTFINDTLKSSDFPIFKNTLLADVKLIEFPFSDDEEDYYTVKLKNQELVINQFNGAIISQKDYPFVNLISRLSVNLHTGAGSILWSIILLIACINILFFIYSGFAMTFKRRASKFKNSVKKDEAKIIVLVGSENGATKKFANVFHEQLLANKELSFITDLNKYTSYKKATKLVIITATYGLGEAPANATIFLKKIQQIKQPNKIDFSVVGFGSMAYSNFCEFASIIDNVLEKKLNFFRQTPLVKINDQSIETFLQWTKTWAKNNKTLIQIPEEKLLSDAKKTTPFTVVNKVALKENPDNTFITYLKPIKKQRFKSGDLLAIYPAGDHRERLYSIGKVNNTIQLSIKIHPKGLGSNFLNNVAVKSNIKARIIKKPIFHFPKKSPSIILIANGTGIAPFLGMLEENTQLKPTYLYAGFRFKTSLNLYKDQLENALKKKKLRKLQIAYSKEEQHMYVQHLLEKDGNFIASMLKNKGTIMICGSLVMHKDVINTLNTITLKFNKLPIEFYKDQLKSDCY